MMSSSQTIGCRADEYRMLFSTPWCKKIPYLVVVPYNLEPAHAPSQAIQHGPCALPTLMCRCLCFSLSLQLKQLLLGHLLLRVKSTVSPLDSSSALIPGWERPYVRVPHFGGNEVGNREHSAKGRRKRRKSRDWSEWGDGAQRSEQLTGVKATNSQAPFAAVFTVGWRTSMAIALPVGGPGAIVNGTELRHHFILLKTQLFHLKKLQLLSQYLELLWYIF